MYETCRRAKDSNALRVKHLDWGTKIPDEREDFDMNQLADDASRQDANWFHAKTKLSFQLPSTILVEELIFKPDVAVQFPKEGRGEGDGLKSINQGLKADGYGKLPVSVNIKESGALRRLELDADGFFELLFSDRWAEGCILRVMKGKLLDDILLALNQLETSHDVVSYTTIAYMYRRRLLISNITNSKKRRKVPEFVQETVLVELDCFCPQQTQDATKQGTLLENPAGDIVSGVPCNVRGIVQPPPHDSCYVPDHTTREPFYARRRRLQTVFPTVYPRQPLQAPPQADEAEQKRKAEELRVRLVADDMFLGPQEPDGTEILGSDVALNQYSAEQLCSLKNKNSPLKAPKDEVSKSKTVKESKTKIVKGGKNKGKTDEDSLSSCDDNTEGEIYPCLDPDREEQMQKDIHSMAVELITNPDAPPLEKIKMRCRLRRALAAKEQLKQEMLQEKKKRTPLLPDIQITNKASAIQKRSSLKSLRRRGLESRETTLPMRWDRCPTFDEFCTYLEKGHWEAKPVKTIEESLSSSDQSTVGGETSLEITDKRLERVGGNIKGKTDKAGDGTKETTKVTKDKGQRERSEPESDDESVDIPKYQAKKPKEKTTAGRGKLVKEMSDYDESDISEHESRKPIGKKSGPEPKKPKQLQKEDEGLDGEARVGAKTKDTDKSKKKDQEKTSEKETKDKQQDRVGGKIKGKTDKAGDSFYGEARVGAKTKDKTSEEETEDKQQERVGGKIKGKTDKAGDRTKETTKVTKGKGQRERSEPESDDESVDIPKYRAKKPKEKMTPGRGKLVREMSDSDIDESDISEHESRKPIGKKSGPEPKKPKHLQKEDEGFYGEARVGAKTKDTDKSKKKDQEKTKDRRQKSSYGDDKNGFALFDNLSQDVKFYRSSTTQTKETMKTIHKGAEGKKKTSDDEGDYDFESENISGRKGKENKALLKATKDSDREVKKVSNKATKLFQEEKSRKQSLGLSDEDPEGESTRSNKKTKTVSKKDAETSKAPQKSEKAKTSDFISEDDDTPKGKRKQKGKVKSDYDSLEEDDISEGKSKKKGKVKSDDVDDDTQKGKGKKKRKVGSDDDVDENTQKGKGKKKGKVKSDDDMDDDTPKGKSKQKGKVKSDDDVDEDTQKGKGKKKGKNKSDDEIDDDTPKGKSKKKGKIKSDDDDEDTQKGKGKKKGKIKSDDDVDEDTQKGKGKKKGKVRSDDDVDDDTPKGKGKKKGKVKSDDDDEDTQKGKGKKKGKVKSDDDDEDTQKGKGKKKGKIKSDDDVDEDTQKGKGKKKGKIKSDDEIDDDTPKGKGKKKGKVRSDDDVDDDTPKGKGKKKGKVKSDDEIDDDTPKGKSKKKGKVRSDDDIDDDTPKGKSKKIRKDVSGDEDFTDEETKKGQSKGRSKKTKRMDDDVKSGDNEGQPKTKRQTKKGAQGTSDVDTADDTDEKDNISKKESKKRLQLLNKDKSKKTTTTGESKSDDESRNDRLKQRAKKNVGFTLKSNDPQSKTIKSLQNEIKSRTAPKTDLKSPRQNKLSPKLTKQAKIRPGTAIRWRKLTPTKRRGKRSASRRRRRVSRRKRRSKTPKRRKSSVRYRGEVTPKLDPLFRPVKASRLASRLAKMAVAGMDGAGNQILTQEEEYLLSREHILLSDIDPWHVSVRFAYLAGGVCDSIGFRNYLLRRRERIFCTLLSAKNKLDMHRAEVWEFVKTIIDKTDNELDQLGLLASKLGVKSTLVPKSHVRFAELPPVYHPEEPLQKTPTQTVAVDFPPESSPSELASSPDSTFPSVPVKSGKPKRRTSRSSSRTSETSESSKVGSESRQQSRRTFYSSSETSGETSDSSMERRDSRSYTSTSSSPFTRSPTPEPRIELYDLSVFASASRIIQYVQTGSCKITVFPSFSDDSISHFGDTSSTDVDEDLDDSEREKSPKLKTALKAEYVFVTTRKLGTDKTYKQLPKPFMTKREENIEGKAETPVPTKRGTTDEGNANTRVTTTRGTTDEGNADTPVSTKSGTLDEGKPETPVTARRDTIEEAKVETPVTARRDTIDEAKVETPVTDRRDTLDEGKPETSVTARRDTIEEAKVETPVTARRDTIEEAKVETSVTARRDTIDEGKPETSVTARRDTIEEAKVETPVTARRDTIDEAKVETPVTARRDTIDNGTVEKSVDIKRGTIDEGKAEKSVTAKRSQQDKGTVDKHVDESKDGSKPLDVPKTAADANQTVVNIEVHVVDILMDTDETGETMFPLPGDRTDSRFDELYRSVSDTYIAACTSSQLDIDIPKYMEEDEIIAREAVSACKLSQEYLDNDTLASKSETRLVKMSTIVGSKIKKIWKAQLSKVKEENMKRKSEETKKLNKEKDKTSELELDDEERYHKQKKFSDKTTDSKKQGGTGSKQTLKEKDAAAMLDTQEKKKRVLLENIAKEKEEKKKLTTQETGEPKKSKRIKDKESNDDVADKQASGSSKKSKSPIKESESEEDLEKRKPKSPGKKTPKNDLPEKKKGNAKTPTQDSAPDIDSDLSDDVMSKKREKDVKGTSKSKDESDDVKNKKREKDTTVTSNDVMNKKREKDVKGTSKSKDESDDVMNKKQGKDATVTSDDVKNKKRDKDATGTSKSKDESDDVMNKKQGKDATVTSDDGKNKKREKDATGTSKSKDESDDVMNKKRGKDATVTSNDVMNKKQDKDTTGTSKSKNGSDDVMNKKREKDATGTSKSKDESDDVMNKKRGKDATGTSDDVMNKKREKDATGTSKSKDESDDVMNKKREKETRKKDSESDNDSVQKKGTSKEPKERAVESESGSSPHQQKNTQKPKGKTDSADEFDNDDKGAARGGDGTPKGAKDAKNRDKSPDKGGQKTDSREKKKGKSTTDSDDDTQIEAETHVSKKKGKQIPTEKRERFESIDDEDGDGVKGRSSKGSDTKQKINQKLKQTVKDNTDEEEEDEGKGKKKAKGMTEKDSHGKSGKGRAEEMGKDLSEEKGKDKKKTQEKKGAGISVESERVVEKATVDDTLLKEKGKSKGRREPLDDSEKSGKGRAEEMGKDFSEEKGKDKKKSKEKKGAGNSFESERDMEKSIVDDKLSKANGKIRGRREPLDDSDASRPRGHTRKSSDDSGYYGPYDSASSTSKIKWSPKLGDVYTPEESGDPNEEVDIEAFKRTFDVTQLKSSYSFEKMYAHRPQAVANYKTLLVQFEKPFKGKKTKPVETKKAKPKSTTKAKPKSTTQTTSTTDNLESDDESEEDERNEVPMVIGKLRTDYKFLNSRDYIPQPLGAFHSKKSEINSLEDVCRLLTKAAKLFVVRKERATSLFGTCQFQSRVTVTFTRRTPQEAQVTQVPGSIDCNIVAGVCRTLEVD